MSVGIERFIACFIMDLQDFYGFKPVYCDPWGDRKVQQKNESEAMPSEEWIILKLILRRFVLTLPWCINLKTKKEISLCKMAPVFPWKSVFKVLGFFIEMREAQEGLAIVCWFTLFLRFLFYFMVKQRKVPKSCDNFITDGLLLKHMCS